MIELERDMIPSIVASLETQTKNIMPGNWKFVGIQIFLVNEDDDIMASPGIYSKAFKKEDYETDED
jgi:hypothetical protein